MEQHELINLFNIHRIKINNYIELYKNFFMYNLDRQIELNKKKSTDWLANLKSPTTFFLVNSLYNKYLDSDIVYEIERQNKKRVVKYDIDKVIQASLDIL